MKVTATISVRNEAHYLLNTLSYLKRNGIYFAILDNQSTDGSSAIYGRPEFSTHLLDVQIIPYRGNFSLKEMLEAEADVASRLETDWLIHHDADEMMHSRNYGESLSAAITRIDALGFNVINFDEFVFLPIEQDFAPVAESFPEILTYYFFEPCPKRLMRAWRKSSNLSAIRHGGHVLEGADLKLAPENLVLRHYIFLNQEHAFSKYTARKFSTNETARGWHFNRLGYRANDFRFPDRIRLKRLAAVDQAALDTSDPWTKHYWEL